LPRASTEIDHVHDGKGSLWGRFSFGFLFLIFGFLARRWRLKDILALQWQLEAIGDARHEMATARPPDHVKRPFGSKLVD
jgi:hypothetical protein